MSTIRKYAGLPDLDIAPDIYETPELTDDASTRPTSTALRSDSRSSSYKGLDDEANGIDRQHLDPDEARTHFLPARVDAKDVDFSDRVDVRRKSYRTSHRRRRKGDVGGDELGDSSDEDGLTPESLQRRIARLHREAEELKAEVKRRHDDDKKEGRGSEPALIGDASLDQLSRAITALTALDNDTNPSAERRLAQKLGTATNTHLSPPSNTSQSQEPGSPSSYTTSHAPTNQSAHLLSKAASFDTRLTLLEHILGLDAFPLPTHSSTPPKPLLPTLTLLDRQLTTLTTSSASSLDAIRTQIHELTLSTEKLDEARKAAKASQDALNSGSRGSFPAAPTSTNIGVEDPEQVSKINALYGTLPTIESLAPLLPPLLDRLRSLRIIHADAASASEGLKGVERRQAEMGKEIREWREGLERVEGLMAEGEGRTRENMGVVEGWVRELEERAKKLER
ncbi:hypothetical protein MMC26_003119 [Xylographa opegraphella]|nr:hypothetical protein [Xylographa opegraphella]